MKLKLGTRRSLLAMAQSGQVAREIERLNPGTQVELVGIETRGDQLLGVSLRAVEGKEFFVAELDHALRDRRVDLTVHSMKDLSVERPEDFVLAAVPRRRLPQDVIFFSPDILERLKRGFTIRIGTSSPRRLENLPSFVEAALPRLRGGELPQLEWVEIRGNVNTRLSRLHESEQSDKRLDAVVLALAGVSRLWDDRDGREELKRLLSGVRQMVVPLRQNPTAPAQGALAVECRADDTETRQVLSRLHHAESASGARAERLVLKEYGGGCHQRFGASSFILPGMTTSALVIRGVSTAGKLLDEVRWDAPPAPNFSREAVFDGTELAFTSEPIAFSLTTDDRAAALWFVAHINALQGEVESILSLPEKRVFVPGYETWKKLAARGIWVEACGESIGLQGVLSLMQEPIFRIDDLDDLRVVTHDRAASREFALGKPIATYRSVEPKPDEETLRRLHNAECIFWASGRQFEVYSSRVSKSAIHCAGFGNTSRVIEAAGFKPLRFPSREEFRAWANQ